ncbi:MAG: hypothetical protein FJX75_16675 [Armatimonadetes bacterium]|nr:hypothetical protein [Armatimonadota bacterium]
MSANGDVAILRELVKQHVEIAAKPIQDERRDLWRRHNSFERTRPPIYVRWLAAWHEAEESKLQCEDRFLQHFEAVLRQEIFQDGIGDDSIQEPWLTLGASRPTPPGGIWGLPYGRIPSPISGGSWMFDPPIKRWEDMEGLAEIHHVIDEEATAANLARIQDAIGDLIEINVDRAPVWQAWHADISYDIANLRGLEQVMWDMADAPEQLHRLCRFLSESIQRIHQEADDAGDWRLCDHQNQASPYALELPDPQANSEPVSRDQLWVFCAAQEMAQVSPAMHDEFVLQYQLPIISRFGLCAYGCCEDLTHKIDMLRRIPNLRRIAVTPVADVAKCAEQIGTDYIFSWRPNPSQMICCGFDPDLIRRVVRDAMEASKGCYVDITLKDVQTVQGNTANLREWVKVVRGISDEYV